MLDNDPTPHNNASDVSAHSFVTFAVIVSFAVASKVISLERMTDAPQLRSIKRLGDFVVLCVREEGGITLVKVPRESFVYS